MSPERLRAASQRATYLSRASQLTSCLRALFGSMNRRRAPQLFFFLLAAVVVVVVLDTKGVRARA